MSSTWIPAIALIVVVGASGCTVRTGAAANTHRPPNHNPPPPPPPKATPHPVHVDSGHRGPNDDNAKWEKLGEGTANGKNDHDVIPVGRSEGTFRALRFRVTHSNVRLQDVVVHFTDGTKFSPTTPVEIREGDVSNVIDLPGNRRGIKSVNFKYSDGRGSGSAQVEVWGRP